MRMIARWRVRAKHVAKSAKSGKECQKWQRVPKVAKSGKSGKECHTPRARILPGSNCTNTER